MTTEVLYASTKLNDIWGGPKRYLAIVIHDTDAEFKLAAQRYRSHPDGWGDAVGAFHPADTRERYDVKKKKWAPSGHPHFAGVIRMSREWLYDDTVVHECVHAAAAIFRKDIRPVVNLGKDCFQNEEDFAYLVGDLTASVSRALTDGGIW